MPKIGSGLFLAMHKKLLTIDRHLLWVIAGVTVSLGSSLVYVDLSGSWTPERDGTGWRVVFFNLTWLCSYLVTLWSGIGAIGGAFARRERKVLVYRILVAYFSLMLMFSGLYYSLASTGDLRDAVSKYIYYRHASQRLKAGLQDSARMLVTDQRAFQGIKPRLWSGVDWPDARLGFRINQLSRDVDVSVGEIFLLSRHPIREVVRFIPDARLDVFLECIHLSVVTMSTLGYGDITPHVRSAKLASDLQVLSGIVLLVVALGLALGGWWESKVPQLDVPARRVKIFLLIMGVCVLFWLRFYRMPSAEVMSWYNSISSVYADAEKGLVQKAQVHAEQALAGAAKYRGSWHYGNAIHEANTALGLLALRAGKIGAANQYLLEAGSTPGSPQLDSFGPRMFLANGLLKAGERETVLKYLDLCSLFWYNKEVLAEWKSEILAGEDPDLANRFIGERQKPPEGASSKKH